MTPSNKPRRCRSCKGLFTRMRPLQRACSPICAMMIALTARTKKDRAADKAQRLKLKPRAKWLEEAQVVFNAWVRQRDAALPCVSCGQHHQGQWHAGHYLSRGARPELRFDEANAHKQCAPCNTYLSGNLALYRIELLRRIGADEVARLEGPQTSRKYTIDELKAIKAEYRGRLNAMSD